jgi:hypothetical protein
MTMDPAELERLLDRRLKRLPLPKAPHTLLPRVLAAVQVRSAAPWHSRSWLAWPRAWQAASAAALVALVAGAVIWWPHALDAIAEWRPQPALRLPAGMAARLAGVDAAWDATRVLWRVLVQPVAGCLVVFVFMMSTACVAFGAALNGVVLGGAFEP